MKKNKRKKSIDISRADKPESPEPLPITEAEDDDLFLEELFDESEEKAPPVKKVPQVKKVHNDTEKTEKKKSKAAFDDLSGDFLSSEEIDAIFGDIQSSKASEFSSETDTSLPTIKEDVETEVDSVAEPIAETVFEPVIEVEPVAEIETEFEGKPADENGTADERISSFDESLDSFTSEDTCSEKKPRPKKFDVIRLGVLTVCICTLVCSFYILINNILEKYKSDLIYNEINAALDFDIPGDVADDDGIVSLLAPDTPGAMTPTMDEIIKNGAVEIVSPGSHAAELAKVRASLENLKNINDDLYGYIMIPGTNISYPIAQHESDNDYYLDRAYTGEHLVNGSIFADVSCNRDVMCNYNTVLFGHNVTSGSMFNHVSMFFDKDFFDNTLIYLYTFDGIFIYKPFSIHETEYDSGYIATGFAEVDHFIKFAEQMRDLSDVKSDAEFTADSRMLTLSTCTNGMYTRRYALHAYLVDSITD